MAGSAAPSTTVPSKKSGFMPVQSRTGLSKTKSRKCSSLIVAVLDELVGFGDDTAQVGHVPVTDVGREDRGQRHAARVEIRRERQHVHRVVGLAAVEEAVREHVEEIVDAGEQGLGELVDVRGQLVGVGQHREPVRQAVDPFGDPRRGVLVEQSAQEVLSRLAGL